jgi:hypothetical protein
MRWPEVKQNFAHQKLGVAMYDPAAPQLRLTQQHQPGGETNPLL